MSFGSWYIHAVTLGFIGLSLYTLSQINPNALQSIADTVVFWQPNAQFRLYSFFGLVFTTVFVTVWIAKRSIKHEDDEE